MPLSSCQRIVGWLKRFVAGRGRCGGCCEAGMAVRIEDLQAADCWSCKPRCQWRSGRSSTSKTTATTTPTEDIGVWCRDRRTFDCP